MFVFLSPSIGRTSNLASVGTNCSFVVDPVLSFIKAFRLKGDSDSLGRVVRDRFSSATVETAKRLLWDSCSQSLEVANLPFQVRRDSENRTLLTANLDDILVAFDLMRWMFET